MEYRKKLEYTTTTDSAEKTKHLANQIGENLKGGEIFLLNGDLGFGKTEFVKGLVSGARIDEEVTSPSFTISNVYKGDKITIYHMDYYRIGSAGVLGDELKEISEDKNNVIVIEWPDVVVDLVPKYAIIVTIKILGDSKREFLFNYNKEFSYLFEGLK